MKVGIAAGRCDRKTRRLQTNNALFFFFFLLPGLVVHCNLVRALVLMSCRDRPPDDEMRGAATDSSLAVSVRDVTRVQHGDA